jgi:ABC-type antimicrobial peptide transport system permease subunit
MYVPQEPIISSSTVLHLRTSADPAALAAALRRKIQQLDSTATVSDVHTVRQEIDRKLSRERLMGTVTGLFGALALVLAALGLYGVMAYGVSRRTREFGIRMAVGAGAARLVLREALWLVAAGLSAGLGVAWLLGRWVRSLLFGIEPWDPASAAIAAAVPAAVALVAAWIPARRASRADPTAALRSS